MTDEKKGPSRLEQIQRGRRAFEIIDFPGREDVQVALRVLTEYEIDLCRIEAWKYVRKEFELDPEKFHGMLHYEREHQTRMLQRAMFIAEDYEKLQTPFANDVEDLKKHITADQRKALALKLADFTSECDPDIDTEKGRLAAEALISELKKKAQTDTAIDMLLRATPPATLRLSLRTIRALLLSSPKDRSSSSS